MRVPLILPALAAALLAFPLAAQEHGAPEPAPSVQPMPVELAPRATEPATAGRARMGETELGLVTGMLMGVAIGGVYRSMTYDEDCAGLREDCLLSRDVETVLFAIMGGSVGGIIGMGTSYLLDRRDRTRLGAPVTVAPAAGGAMRVGVTLAH